MKKSKAKIVAFMTCEQLQNVKEMVDKILKEGINVPHINVFTGKIIEKSDN